MVSFPPSLQPATEALHACAAAHSEMALIIQQNPAGSLDLDQVDLALWLGNPPESADFAAPLAWEEIVFILNPENPVEALDEEALQALFSGRWTRWNEVGGDDTEVVIWGYPEENELQTALSAYLQAGSYLPSQAYLAPDPGAMLEAVASDPAAIGFLPRAWLGPQVKVVESNAGVDLAMRRPLLALAAAEPQNMTRILLHCLQSAAGKDVLAERYISWN
jgi:ABC-type phosphate transport system substrate-binding protein